MREEASTLVSELAKSLDNGFSRSLLSPVIYDTAWSSIISKGHGNGCSRWLFPESFQTVLQKQLPNGTWGSSVSEVDGILNTMAALLAILRHQNQPLVQGCPALLSDLHFRISNSILWLDKAFQGWDAEASDHVGFELLVPSLLRLLRAEGVRFTCPGADTLDKLNRKEMEKFDLSMLYGPAKSTLLHSLEAFIGILDFDRVKHHKRSGSMMASLASTAAYLMYTSQWDDEAGTYLCEANSQ